MRAVGRERRERERERGREGEKERRRERREREKESSFVSKSERRAEQMDTSKLLSRPSYRYRYRYSSRVGDSRRCCTCGVRQFKGQSRRQSLLSSSSSSSSSSPSSLIRLRAVNTESAENHHELGGERETPAPAPAQVLASEGQKDKDDKKYKLKIRRARISDSEKVSSLCADVFATDTTDGMKKAAPSLASWLDFIKEWYASSISKELQLQLRKALEGKIVATKEAQTLKLRYKVLKEKSKRQNVWGFEKTSGAQNLKRLIASKDMRRMFCCLLAENDDGEVVASVTMSMTIPDAKLPAPFPTSGIERFYIGNMVVREDYRRKGVATDLLEKCEILAERWNCGKCLSLPFFLWVVFVFVKIQNSSFHANADSSFLFCTSTQPDSTWLHVAVASSGAQKLYKKLGYSEKSIDPWWMVLEKRYLYCKKLQNITKKFQRIETL